MLSLLVSLALSGPGCAIDPTEEIAVDESFGFEADEKATVAQRLAALESKAATASTQIAALQTANTSLSAKLTTANTQLAKAKARITALETADTTSVAAHDALAAEVDGLDERVRDLDANQDDGIIILGGLQADFADVSTTLAAHDRSLGDLSTRVDTAQLSAQTALDLGDALGRGFDGIWTEVYAIQDVLPCEESGCLPVASKQFVAEGFADVSNALDGNNGTFAEAYGVHEVWSASESVDESTMGTIAQTALVQHFGGDVQSDVDELSNALDYFSESWDLDRISQQAQMDEVKNSIGCSDGICPTLAKESDVANVIGAVVSVIGTDRFASVLWAMQPLTWLTDAGGNIVESDDLPTISLDLSTISSATDRLDTEYDEFGRVQAYTEVALSSQSEALAAEVQLSELRYNELGQLVAYDEAQTTASLADLEAEISQVEFDSATVAHELEHDLDMCHDETEAVSSRVDTLEETTSAADNALGGRLSDLETDLPELQASLDDLTGDYQLIDGRLFAVEDYLGIGRSTCPSTDPDLDGDALCNSDDSDDDGDGEFDCIDNDMDGDGLFPADDDDIDGDTLPNVDDATPFGETCG